MAQLIVRNLEEDVRDKLREMAQDLGQSMEETARGILRRAVMEKKPAQPSMGSRFAQRFTAKGLKQEIPELRGQVVKPPSFDQ